MFSKRGIINQKFKNSLKVANEIINKNVDISLDNSEHPIYKVIQIFARSIQSKYLQYIITTPEFDITNPNDINLFQPKYQLAMKQGIPSSIFTEIYTKDKTTLDFTKDVVISFPWSLNRFERVAKYIKRGNWKYDVINHEAQFIEPFKIGIIKNGHHSSSIGILNSQGELPAQIIDMTNFYQWIFTDGRYFYSVETKKKIGEVDSFEEAVIFEIGRLIYTKKMKAKS